MGKGPAANPAQNPAERQARDDLIDVKNSPDKGTAFDRQADQDARRLEEKHGLKGR
jgi:hypothetical protein